MKNFNSSQLRLIFATSSRKVLGKIPGYTKPIDRTLANYEFISIV